MVLNKVFAATWDAAIERLATQIYNGEVKPSDLDKDLVLKNYSALSKSSQAAWGNGYYNDELTRKMRDNIMKFSGAKSYDLMTKLQALNVGGISKEAFILQSKSVINLHNEAWLNTEQKYVANKTSTAKDFIQFNADIDIYPNLKVRTMQDDNVRESHAANEGVVMPVNKCTYTPPFDPGCRCWLEQTTDEVTDHGLTNMNSKWATNPYPSGELFSKEHSYQKSIEKKQHTIVTDNTNRMKQYAPYNRIEKSKGGNSIFINDFADASEVAQNKVAAEITADLLDKNIYIRAHINTSTNHKNPELAIGNPTTLCDLKTYDKDKSTSIRSFIKNNIGSANNQGCEYVVLDLSSATKDDFEKNTILKLRGELNDKKKMNTGIKQIIIINGNKSGVLSRKQINSNEYITHFDKLFK